MHKLRFFIFAAILQMVYCQAAFAAKTSDDVDNALVMVLARSFVGRGAGNGFVIGDGTLVITACHLVFAGSEKGRHKEAGLVSVVSPYLGDGCEARIVAVDEEIDLAVLKIPWTGHPALRLAEEDDLMSAKRLMVTGIPEIVRSLSRSETRPMQVSLDRQSENLPVDYIAVRRKIPLFISLGEKGQLGDGWSGSPILLPDSDLVAGCFTSINTDRRTKRVRARGPAISQVGRLLKEIDAGVSLHHNETSLLQPEDSTDAFLSFVQAYRHYLLDQHGWASDKIEKLIAMRPESSFAFILSASNAAGQEDFDLADQHYRKAIALNPETPGLRFYYAQFLADRQPDKSLELLEGLWESNELRPSVAAIMFNILSGRGEFQRAGKLLTEALEVNPENGNLWMGLGACRLQSGDLDGAITAFTKAVELLPERGPFRGQLAHMLEKAGRLDEAERHFRELLNIEPKNPVVHLWLARFLGKHRPEAKEEALKEGQIALELPRRKGLPKEKIEQVIQELQSETKQAP